MSERSAETIYASWCARQDAGETSEFEELVSENPDVSERLHELHRQRQDVEGALRAAGVFGSAALPPGSPRGANEVSSSRYAVEEEVGRGGTGVVLRVRDESLDRHIAMKRLADDPAPGRRQRLRFLREARITAQLDHPGIVPVHELDNDARGAPFFTMKLVEGKTLSQVFEELHDGSPDWTQARVVALILRVGEAVSYAHERGVIHRDLKPSNVMVGRFGEVYVMDWGLAGIRDEAELPIPEEVAKGDDHRVSPRALTVEGDALGTPSYMPPEQAEGRLQDVGPASDVYGVGAMLYHLLAGHEPYVDPGSGEEPTARQVWERVKAGPPVALAKIAPRAPTALLAICGRAMDRDPEARYASMSELTADLSAYLEGRVVQDLRGPLVEAKLWVLRNRALSAALGAALLLLLSGLVVALVLRERALQKERLAEARTRDVLRLSALQELEDLHREAGALWPPYPDRSAELEAWIARAQALVADLPLHVDQREELRRLALPQSEAERLADVRSHPEFGRLERLRGRLDWKRNALNQRRDGVAVELPDVAGRTGSAETLRLEAWHLVMPDRAAFGDEPLGLALARRAMELAGDDPFRRAKIAETVAWACLALGRDDEALEAGAQLLAEAPDANKPEFAVYLETIEKAVEEASSPGALEREVSEVQALEREVAELEGQVEARRTWRFPPEHREASWWNAQLSKLIDGLEELAHDETGLLAADGISPGAGWSVPRRLAHARRYAELFAEQGEHGRRWTSAATELRARYPQLDLRPQIGLVPLGPDPESGLWEFWHVPTGAEPVRDERGRLTVTEESGVVLVLLPGGEFRMGSQRVDPAAPNYDPEGADEGPVHTVRLSPFFLSKYEMTQGQWLRIAGVNPSLYQPGQRWYTAWLASGALVSVAHPVENVSWDDCMRWLPRAGLRLPTDAQWEYANRAGTSSVYWTGTEKESLQGAANLADRYARENGGPDWQNVQPWLDDGATIHAPVGTYRPNPFGLHDTVGNVWELCLDGFDPSFYARSPLTDPVAPYEAASAQVTRGASFTHGAGNARSSRRVGTPPSVATDQLGVRPALSIVDE